MSNLDNMNALVAFDPKAIGSLGNQFLNILIEHQDRRDSAEQELAQADKRDAVIDAELVKVCMYLHSEEKVNLLDVYSGNNKTIAAVNRAILTEMGVYERKMEGDTVVYQFTDDNIRQKFDFDAKKATDGDADHIAARSRRNGLNVRLSKAVKAAISLIDAKATVDDVVISQNAETGQTEVKITKAPKQVMGKEKELVLQGTSGKKAEGAEYSSTLNGLAKYADKKHKSDDTASKQKTESSDSKANPSQGAVSEEDFLATVNTLIQMVKGREGTFSKQEKTAMANLMGVLA